MFPVGHFRVPFASVSKRVQVRNLSCENQLSSQVHSDANLTHFHMKGFALGLVLKKRQKVTRKWLIISRNPLTPFLFEGTVRLVSGVITQGWRTRYSLDFVTQYRVSHSLDGQRWDIYKEDGQERVKEMVIFFLAGGSVHLCLVWI